MAHFVGLDVSVKETSVYVVDDAGQVVLEQKVPTEPADIIPLLTSLGATFGGSGSRPARCRNGWWLMR
jgi:transposase